MKIFNNFNTIGDVVNLRKTHSGHLGFDKKIEDKENIAVSFGKTLNNALKKVNNLQVEAGHLTQKMITTPNEVNVHEVMIAVQKAQFSLNFTKTLRDKVVRAYQDIMNMR